MKRKPLVTWFPFRFVLLIAPLMAAWPQRATAGDWVFDNNAVTITDAVATTVSWTATDVWNPNGSNPGAAADGVWANAILNATALPVTTSANTVLNIDLGTNSRSINRFMQTGQNTTTPNNVTTNIVATAGTSLTLNEIYKSLGGTLQFGPNLEIIAAVDAGRNPTGDLRVLNTDDSALQLQGKITTPGNLIKDGSGQLRLGTSGTAFNGAISGNIIVNNGLLELSTNNVFNPAAGTGRAIIMNGPNSTINFRPQTNFDFVREIDIHNDTTLSVDRSAGTLTGQTVTTGVINVNANDKYLQVNSLNAFNYSFDGINLGTQTLNIRNGLNGAASIGAGVLRGSGIINVSGNGNTNSGLNFNTASPSFSGSINLFEGNNHTISASGALGSGTIVLGAPGNVLPISYPNQAVGLLATPTVRSEPWWAALNYNANNPTSAPVAVTVNAGSQVNMGVVPSSGDVIQLNPHGILQGSSAELGAFTVGTNLLLSRNAIISHEVLGGSDPVGIGTIPVYYHGLSANLNGPVTIGAGTAWTGLSNDRVSRNIGGSAATVITVNGGDADPTTIEATLLGVDSGTLGIMKDTTGLIAGGTWASASGRAVTLAIRGQSSTFGGLGAANQPGGNVQFFASAAASGLSTAVVDKIVVESGNFWLNAANGLGGVPVEVLGSGGLDISAANSIDGNVTFRKDSSFMLNDNFTLTGTGTLNFDSGARLNLVGNNPLLAATSWTTWTQPINLPSTNTDHLVRIGIDNIANLDANVPDRGAIWEIAASGANTTTAPAGTNLTAVQTITQTAGITTDGGIITNDAGGSRSFVGPVNIGARGATIAATTTTSLVLMNPINAGAAPIQIGSLTPVDGVTKTGNPLVLSTNSNDPVSFQNANPNVILEGGLISGPVNLVSGNLALDGLAANTKINGDLTMGDNTVLYLGGGGNISTGTISTGAGPFRGDLTPSLVAAPGSNVTTGSIILGNRSRVELAVDNSYAAWTASLVGGRGQINQAFVITGDLNPTDRRNIWVDRGAQTTVIDPVDLNDITLRAGSIASIQESSTDIRAAIKLQGNATFVGVTSGVDLKSVTNISGGPVTLNLGRPDIQWNSTATYGAVSSGVTFNNVNSRLEVRDGTVLDSGFVFNDNSNPRAIMAQQNTSQGGPNVGTDHTLSFFQGATGVAATYQSNGTFNMNTATNAVGGYVNDAASGAPLVNVIGSAINLNAAGGVVFSQRANADAAVNGVTRFAKVNVNAADATLATRDLSDLEIGTLTITQNSVIKVDGARTDSAVSGTGAVRIGTVAAGTNSVHFQDGRTSVTGNLTSGALTVGGTSMEFNPGVAGTSTVSATSVTVNTMLAAKSGTTDFGSTTITGTAIGTAVAGLREGRIAGAAMDLATANPASSAVGANQYSDTNLGIRLDPRNAQNNSSGVASVDTARGWSNNETWVYSGQVFVDAGGKLSLAENIDDNVDIVIDGVRVLNTNIPAGGAGQVGVAPFQSFSTVTNTSTKDGLNQGVLQPNTVINNANEGDIGQGLANTTHANINESGGNNTFTPGWHDIAIRLHNGTGGAGSPGTLGWGNYFGLGLSTTGTTSFFGTDYTKPIDNGSMNLFRTTTVAKGNVDVDNNSSLRAGTIKTIGSLTFGRGGVAGASAVVLTAAATGDVDTIDVATTASGGSKLDIVDAAGKLVTKELNVADTKTFTLNGVAGSKGELEITAGAAVTVNSAAAISVAGGTLRLSNTVGTATGNAPISINGGTLAGNGITTSPVTLNTGNIAPGNSPGLLTTGSLLTTGGSYLLDIAGTSLAANGSLYDSHLVNGTVDLGAGVTTLTLNLTYAPALGDSFWPLLNDGADSILGNYAGLPEGGILVSGGFSFQITYLADGSTAGPSSLTGGNDVALTTVAVPEASTVGLLGLTSLLALRRRRLQIVG
jgi:hypothetical protein